MLTKTELTTIGNAKLSRFLFGREFSNKISYQRSIRLDKTDIDLLLDRRKEFGLTLEDILSLALNDGELYLLR